jgi:hypothetical protein
MFQKLWNIVYEIVPVLNEAQRHEDVWVVNV